MYIGYLPSYVRYHSGLTDKEKLLYCELTALADQNSFVKLDRPHLCKALNVKEFSSIRRYLNKLGKLKLIELIGDDHIAFNSNIREVVAYSQIEVETEGNDEAAKLTEELVTIWNDHFGTEIRSTKKRIGMVRGRLKSFKRDEILHAIDNRIYDVENNDWYDDPDHAHFKDQIELVIRDDERTEKYVNFVKRARKIDFGKQTVSAKTIVRKDILE
jgi:hypothetical protein